MKSSTKFWRIYHDRNRKKTIYGVVNVLMLLLNEDAKAAAAAAQAAAPTAAPPQEQALVLCTAQNNTPGSPEVKEEIEKARKAFLRSNKKEIDKMPMELQAKIRKALLRDPRYHNGVYEKRATIEGVQIYACSKSAAECERIFIAELTTQFAQELAGETKQRVVVPSNFHEFALFYLERVKKRTTVQRTYESILNRYKNHVQDKLKRLPLRAVTTEILQDLIDGIDAAGLGKTAEDVRSLLNGIFEYALARGLIRINPMAAVILLPHEREHGTALTLDEQKLLLETTAGTEYQTMFAVALFTGIRPYEYETASLHGQMIIAQNCKRKTAILGKIEWKRIPVCPMLAPFLAGLEDIELYSADTMRRKFHAILPNHTLKDLRRTFYSMCDNLKVDQRAKKEMVGHAKDALEEAYQELSDDFLIEEAQKIVTKLHVEPITPISPPKKDRFGLARKAGKQQKPRFTPKK